MVVIALGLSMTGACLSSIITVWQPTRLAFETVMAVWHLNKVLPAQAGAFQQAAALAHSVTWRRHLRRGVPVITVRPLVRVPSACCGRVVWLFLSFAAAAYTLCL